MDVDPAASMRCWAIELRVQGRTFDIPALPAADWWPVLTSGDPGKVLDFIVSDPKDPANLDDLLLSGELDEAELSQALVEAIEQAAGRSLHAALVLAITAEMGWATVGGELARRGFRWDVMPLGAALDAVYFTVASALDQETTPKFQALLENEGMTTGKPRGRNRKRITREFEAMAGPKPTTGVVATGAPSDSAHPKTQPRPRPPRPAGPSRVPTRPRARPAGSGPAASSSSPPGAAGPASDTEPRPPL